MGYFFGELIICQSLCFRRKAGFETKTHQRNIFRGINLFARVYVSAKKPVFKTKPRQRGEFPEGLIYASAHRSSQKRPRARAGPQKPKPKL